MKKPFCCFAALLVLFLLVMPASAKLAPEETMSGNAFSLYRLASLEWGKSICADGEGGGYFLSSNALYSFTFSAEKQNYDFQALVLNSQRLVAIAVSDEGSEIYALTQKQEVMRLSDGVFEKLPGIAPSDVLIDHAVISWAEDLLYYSYADENGQAQLCSYDLRTGEYKRDSVFDTPWCVYDAESKRVLGFKYNQEEGQWYLSSYGESAGQAQAIHLMEGYHGSHDVTYFSSEKAFYLPNGTGVERHELSGETKSMLGVPDMDMLTALGEDSFAGLRFGILRVYQAVEQPISAITTFGHGTKYSLDFTQKTGIVVNELAPRGGDGLSELATAMVTRDDRVDLYAFAAYDGLLTIKEKGFYVDLRQSKALSQAHRQLYPAFADAMLNDMQEIVAWPVTSNVMLREHDHYIIEQYHISVPDNWDEALDLVKELEEQDFFADNDYVPFDMWQYNQQEMLAYLEQEYLLGIYTAGGKLTFDTPVFRRLAERILREVPIVNPYPRRGEGESMLFMSASSNILNENFIAPLKVDPDAPEKINAALRVFVINPYSKHKEEALQYLEFLAGKRTLEDYGLYQSMDQPILNESTYKQWEAAQAELANMRDMTVADEQRQDAEYRMAQLEETIRYLEESMYMVSQKAIDNYQQFAKQFVVLEDSLILYNDKFAELSQRMIHGGISLDEFIKQADDYIDMVQTENDR